MSDTAAPKRRRGRPRRDEGTGDSMPTPPPAEPKAKPPRAAAPPKSAGRPSASEKLERQLRDQLGAIGLTLSMIHPRDGTAIVRRADELAAAFARLADQNPRVRRILEGGMTSSAWLGVVIAVGGLSMELAANHGAAPAFLATPDPTSSSALADIANLFAPPAPAPAHSNGAGPT